MTDTENSYIIGLKGIFALKKHNNLTLFNKAFTLAEILITLAIIGVIAAITIPSLMSSYLESTRINALKRAYSNMSNALLMAITNQGTLDSWGFTSGTGAVGQKQLVDILEPYLKVTEHATTSYYSTTLTDGTKFYVWINSANCSGTQGTSAALTSNVCGEMWIYVKPESQNIFGKNVFWFWITKTGLVPEGTADVSGSYSFASYCDKDNLSQASAVGSGGRGCTAWVLYNNNMDYLNCDGLSWAGAKRCSEL